MLQIIGMGDINIRELDNGLVASVKAAAALEQVSMKEWIIGAMEDKLRRSDKQFIDEARATIENAPYKGKTDKQIILEAQARLEERKKSIAPMVSSESKAELDKKILEEAQRKLEDRKKEVVPIAPLMGRAGHSPKTCRLYGCLQCKEAGHKDPIRGV